MEALIPRPPGAHDSANPRNVPMWPRRPQGVAPPPRGGFFRALSHHRHTDLLNSEFDGAVPTSCSSPTMSIVDSFGGSPCESPGRQFKEKDALAACLFLDKLNLDLLERLWVAIKKNCMLNTVAGRSQGVYEAINLADFLKLAWQQIPHHSADDEHFLERLFHCVDRRKKGSVRTTDIATALVLVCNADPIRGQRDGLSKLKTLFRIFDADDDSCLDFDEIFDMYLSIKANDVTKTRQALIADITFDDELSLHEAKRLYELTIELLNVVSESEFVIFDEFSKVFDQRPDLISELLPGAFTLEWILADYKSPWIENNSFGSDAKRGLIDAMRRGEEHLDLSKKRGRGQRIMQNCLPQFRHRPTSDEERSHASDAHDVNTSASPAAAAVAGAAAFPDSPLPSVGSARTAARACRASLPKITSASRSARTPRRQSAKGKDALDTSANRAKLEDDEDEAEDDDDSDDDDVDGYGPGGRDEPGKSSMNHSVQHSVAASNQRGQAGVKTGSIGKANLPPEALDLPQLEVLHLNHTHSMRFRTMMLDAKTQQAYLRDKKDVNRTLKYQCLVCAVNHDFRLNKFNASAEHQHTH